MLDEKTRSDVSYEISPFIEEGYTWHYNRATYDAGCRGPLCRRQRADWYAYKKYQEQGVLVGAAAQDATYEQDRLTLFIMMMLHTEGKEIPAALRFVASERELGAYRNDIEYTKRSSILFGAINSMSKIAESHERRTKRWAKEAADQASGAKLSQ